jgi:hypothetical protein
MSTSVGSPWSDSSGDGYGAPLGSGPPLAGQALLDIDAAIVSPSQNRERPSRMASRGDVGD